MSVCASGASTTKPGVPAAVIVDQAYVQSLLPAGLAWLYPYLPYMHGLQIGDVGAFCAADPPTFGVPTGDDIFALVTGGDFGQAAIVQTFMQNVTRAYLWSQLCKCTSGTTPGPPTAPTSPTDLPAINPTGVVALPLNPNCDNLHNSNGTIGPYLSPAGTWHSGDTANPMAYIFTNTSVPTSYQLTLKNNTVSGTGLTLSYQYKLIAAVVAGGAPGGSTLVTLSPGASQVIIIPASASLPVLELWLTASAPGTGTANSDGTMLEAFCGGATPGGSVAPCCPPDPTQTGLLNLILQAVTLIQRQAAAFAYVPGAAHSGLSGNGTITVSGLIGLKIDLTTTPSRLGTVLGDPIALWDAGWVNLGTTDGFGPRQFITSDPTIILPVSGAVTVIGYSIPSDCTVTITELIREP